MSQADVFDAIVVGSGAAGSWACKELAEKGLRVLMLEAGRNIDPEKDFPVPPPSDSGLLTRVRGGVSGQHIQARGSSYSAMTRDFYVSDRQNPYTTARGKPFNWFRGRQLGGRLHTWARMSIRMSDLEFKAASLDGIGTDWPISYEDLAPYYDRVEQFLGLDGDRDGLATIPDGQTTRPVPPTKQEADFRRTFEKEWPDRPVISPRVIRHNPGRMPKELLAARRSGRLVERTGAVVDRVLFDINTGRASGVSFIDQRTKESEEALGKIIVLCASAIETVRIMLNSDTRQHPGGLGNSSGNLGKYLMNHTMVGIRGRLPDGQYEPAAPDADPYDFARAHGMYVPRFQNLDGNTSEFLRGFHMQGAIGRGGPGWWLLAFGEVLPHASNRVTLDPDVTDAWGVPVARIDYEHQENERLMIAAQIEFLQEVSHLAGLEVSEPGGSGLINSTVFNMFKGKVLSKDGAFVPGAAIHEVGGASMGETAQTSVLNKFNQVWDSPNVFVTDGSCFVSSGCQNNTLTIMALTARACDYIVDDYWPAHL